MHLGTSRSVHHSFLILLVDVVIVLEDDTRTAWRRRVPIPLKATNSIFAMSIYSGVSTLIDSLFDRSLTNNSIHETVMLRDMGLVST
jgi:hypothetical protein